MADRPTPTLAEALANMGQQINDNAGQMVHGHRWPEVKAQLEAQAEQAARDAAQQAVADRRRAQVRLALFSLLLVFLMALAPAVVVLAWRVAL